LNRYSVSNFLHYYVFSDVFYFQKIGANYRDAVALSFTASGIILNWQLLFQAFLESIADKHLQELLPLVEVPALIILVNVSLAKKIL
jgi:ACR3 family arsenite transporter